MTTSLTPDPTKSTQQGQQQAPKETRRPVVLPGRFEDPYTRQQRLQRTGERDPWSTAQQPHATLRYANTYPGSIVATTQTSLSLPPPGLTNNGRTTPAYAALPSSQVPRWSRDPWANRQTLEYHESPPITQWPVSPLPGQYPTDSMSQMGDMSTRPSYGTYQGAWPAPMLRRTSSDENRHLAGYYSSEPPTSSGSLQAKAYPQRRPSNRDEFDGPSQLLEKPMEQSYEPKEEELPQLPITLYAQEQDEILSQVNDRLSQCAFDFVAKYQFPVPIEPDKRPVRVPADREWSEWVYLLKRLATKRRIPARVLYNGQIKQLITILENSLEMRHAAKHQSRPLKDDRNILQLISSGLQVAKILKDAPAMQYLDGLYIQTERLIGGRRVPVPATTYAG